VIEMMTKAVRRLSNAAWCPIRARNLHDALPRWQHASLNQVLLEFYQLGAVFGEKSAIRKLKRERKG